MILKDTPSAMQAAKTIFQIILTIMFTNKTPVWVHFPACRPVLYSVRVPLKGVCHEIFDPNFFWLSINPIWARLEHVKEFSL